MNTRKIMKNLKAILFILLLLTGFIAKSQTPETIRLTQTPGKFTQTELTLEAGKQYVFDIDNQGVEHNVGFVITPANATGRQYHIKEAYLKNTISDGEHATSDVVTLPAGEYVYFCPLNPTPEYTITVE